MRNTRKNTKTTGKKPICAAKSRKQIDNRSKKKKHKVEDLEESDDESLFSNIFSSVGEFFKTIMKDR